MSRSRTARLAVSPDLFDSSITPDNCYPATHSDYTPKLQCAQLHTRLATIYNYPRIQHGPHFTIVGSTPDETRRKNQKISHMGYGMTTSTPSEEHTYHT